MRSSFVIGKARMKSKDDPTRAANGAVLCRKKSGDNCCDNTWSLGMGSKWKGQINERAKNIICFGYTGEWNRMTWKMCWYWYQSTVPFGKYSSIHVYIPVGNLLHRAEKRDALRRMSKQTINAWESLAYSPAALRNPLWTGTLSIFVAKHIKPEVYGRMETTVCWHLRFAALAVLWKWVP